MKWWWLCLVVATLVSAAPASDPARLPRELGPGEGEQLLAQSSTGQYQGKEDHIELEYNTIKQITGVVSIVNVSDILLGQDKKFDDQLSTRPVIHYGVNVSCAQAPECATLNRRPCEATADTCGTCLKGFAGEFGDANTPCKQINCARAPPCAELNREACSTTPNTCGPCLAGFHTPDSTWLPDEKDLEDGNSLCMAVRFRPVVFVHGLGDIYNGPGLSFITSMVRGEFHMIRTFSAEPGGGVFSMAKPLPLMVEDFVKQIRAIPSLKDGFNLVGISQGGLIARAYVEKYNEPPVHSLISLHGPQSGIAKCPGPQGFTAMPCEYAMHWALATPHDYWRGRDYQGRHSKDTYLGWHSYLQDINNEGDAVNATYRLHMLTLHRYVLVRARYDRVVDPAESEWHGYYAWGDMSRVLRMEDTEEYQQDRIGLRTLNESGRLLRLMTNGPHVNTPREFWNEELFPLLDNGWYQNGQEFDLYKTLKAHATSAA